MQKTTADLILESIARYENFEGPDDDLPYVVRVFRRNESLGRCKSRKRENGAFYLAVFGAGFTKELWF